jgi:hypothetical protein
MLIVALVPPLVALALFFGTLRLGRDVSRRRRSVLP